MQLTYSLNGGSGGGGGGDGTDAVARRQIAELKTAFEAHEEDKDNPHEVTAEQAGAASGFVKEADLVERLAAYAKDADLKAVELSLANHKADFNNPHRVTAEQTGGGGGGGSRPDLPSSTISRIFPSSTCAAATVTPYRIFTPSAISRRSASMANRYGL